MSHFAKYQATGNDYLVVEPHRLPFPLTPETVRLLCDRHLGVGSDGLLALQPSDKADFGLRIYNPDGSQAEKSGNGLRIFAKYLYQHGATNHDHMTIETPGGVVSARLQITDWRVTRVAMGMGQAAVGDPEPLEVNGETLKIIKVDVGNPHCVILVDDLQAVDLPRLGPAIENHPAFPERTNVQFVQVKGRDGVAIRIWERGVGETLGSGTSACAVAAACVKRGLTDRDLTVTMEGGSLTVRVAEDGSLTLEGSAEEICIGDLSREILDRLEAAGGQTAFA